jgi:protoheme IX farnesyltransferase
MTDAPTPEPTDPSETPTEAPGFLKDVFDLTKPRLSLLVLITSAGGMWLAAESVPARVWFLGTLGTAMVVGAANMLNNYLERESDKLMVRTRTRALPAGRLNPAIALWLGVTLAAISIVALTLGTTPLAGALAAAAFILYVMVYTPLKRKSSVHTLVGAIPGAMPPLIGWTAVTGSIDVGGMLLFGLLFLWQLPHSLAITIYRESDYEAAGIVVMPLELGVASTRRHMLMYTLPLCILPYLMMEAGIAGMPTLIIGTALGLVFTWKCVQGLRKELGAVWARSLFLFSLVYLVAMFVVLCLDQVV